MWVDRTQGGPPGAHLVPIPPTVTSHPASVAVILGIASPAAGGMGGPNRADTLHLAGYWLRMRRGTAPTDREPFGLVSFSAWPPPFAVARCRLPMPLKAGHDRRLSMSGDGTRAPLRRPRSLDCPTQFREAMRYQTRIAP